jgi:hypothetical protein
VPGLALVEASHVGKGLLADALAATLGQSVCGTEAVLSGFALPELSRALIKFDEQMPVNQWGKPRSDELKRIITEDRRQAQAKHRNASTLVGAVRVLVTGQAATRLFVEGVLSEADRDAIARRFLAIRIPRGSDRERACKEILAGIGDADNPKCPERFARVVGHLVWLQAQERSAPGPDATALAGVLKVGGSTMDRIIEALEVLVGCGGALITEERIHFRSEAMLGRLPELKTVQGLLRALEPLGVEAHNSRACPFAPGESKGRRWHSVALDVAVRYGYTRQD